MNTLNEDLARKVLEVVDQGLVIGKGEPIPGKMDVEATVCYAMGLPHSDKPPCVGKSVRSFNIRLNDSPWSSDKARAIGMRKLAIAQLGSDTIDQKAFAAIIAEQTIRQIVPIALRAVAARTPKLAEILESTAFRCENDGDIAAAKAAHLAAMEARYFIGVTVGASYSAAAAAAAANAAAEAASYAASYAVTAATAATASASYATAAASYAAYYAAADDNAAAIRDKILMVYADIGLTALVKLKSPGCEYLWLTEKE